MHANAIFLFLIKFRKLILFRSFFMITNLICAFMLDILVILSYLVLKKTIRSIAAYKPEKQLLI